MLFPPDVSVVIPTRNEEENALPIAEAVIRQILIAGIGSYGQD